MDKYDDNRVVERYCTSSEDPRHYNSTTRHFGSGADGPIYAYRQDNYRGGRVGSAYGGGSSDGSSRDGREDCRLFDSPPRYPPLHSGGDDGFGPGLRTIGDGVGGFRSMVEVGGRDGGFQFMGGRGRQYGPGGGVGGHFRGGSDREKFPPFGGNRGDGERFQPMGGGRGDGERFQPMGGGRGEGERFQPMGGGRGDGERFQPLGTATVDGERFQPSDGSERVRPIGASERFPPMGGTERFPSMFDGGVDGGTFRQMGEGAAFRPSGVGSSVMFGAMGSVSERFQSIGGGNMFQPLGGAGSGAGDTFQPMYGGGGGDRFQPMGVGVDAESFTAMGSSGNGKNFQPVGKNDGEFNLDNNHGTQSSFIGQKRGYSFYGRERSPDRSDGGIFVKLFVGSVPRTATELDIHPLFDKHGNVMEVALIRDKRTGQQQGCCFVKYASSEEADRAIRALHNQYTLPGGVGPIQVRYADGERERLGATEYKLFVGSLNKQATEKEVEEIFLRFGRVEDVYLMRDEMKQSRGCGFVKYSQREMAEAAINALNGTYTMRGCDQPLNVRFADPKRPKAGELRGGPAFFSIPAIRPAGDLSGAPTSLPSASNIASSARSGDKGISSIPSKPPNIYSCANEQLDSSQTSHSAEKSPTCQVLPVRKLPVFNQLSPFSETGTQGHDASLTSGHSAGSASQLPVQKLQPCSQSTSQLSHMLSQQKHTLQSMFQSSQQNFNQLQQQVQQLKPSTSNSHSNLAASPGLPVSKQQSRWNGIALQCVPSTSNVPLAGDAEVSTSASFSVPAVSTVVASANCNWTEHISPDGYKYYYNSSTGESKWEKPEELVQYEQPQQQRRPYIQHSEVQSHPHGSMQQIPQMQVQRQRQFSSQYQNQMQPHSFQSSLYPDPEISSKSSSKELSYTQIPRSTDPVSHPTRYQQIQVPQEWIWKNQTSGT